MIEKKEDPKPDFGDPEVEDGFGSRMLVGSELLCVGSGWMWLVGGFAKSKLGGLDSALSR